MLFKTGQSLALLQGKLASINGRFMLVGLDGTVFDAGEVAFVVPDDEVQAAAVRAAGYPIHTPMSMHLGDGATNR